MLKPLYSILYWTQKHLLKRHIAGTRNFICYNRYFNRSNVFCTYLCIISNFYCKNTYKPILISVGVLNLVLNFGEKTLEISHSFQNLHFKLQLKNKRAVELLIDPSTKNIIFGEMKKKKLCAMRYIAQIKLKLGKCVPGRHIGTLLEKNPVCLRGRGGKPYMWQIMRTDLHILVSRGFLHWPIILVCVYCQLYFGDDQSAHKKPVDAYNLLLKG